MTNATTSSHPRLGRRLGVGIAAGLLAVGLGVATVQAKEIGSGGGGGGTVTTCSPVSSLSVKSDARVGELGFAAIDVSYGVKPCVAGQAVTVTTSVNEYSTPGVYAWLQLGAPLNGKFTVNGVKVRTTYQVTVTVVDAVTGAVVGSQSAYTAAIPKGV